MIWEKILLIFSIVFCINCSSSAINNPYTGGSRANSLAGSGVVLIDTWSVYNNQACLGYLSFPSISINHTSGLIKEQDINAVAIAYPTTSGTFAVNYSYFGYKYYNENSVGVAFGRELHKILAIGVRLNYFNTTIHGNYDDYHLINFDVGLASRPLNNIILGVQLYNPVNIMNKGKELNLSPIIRCGIGYNLQEKVFLTTELEKTPDYDANLKVGIEGSITKHLAAAFGVTNVPGTYSFGLALKTKNISANISFLKHPSFGYKPSLSITYKFKK